MWALSVFSLNLRRIMAYRVDFWLNSLCVMLAHVSVAYVVWNAIFSNRATSDLNGYSFQALMFYYLLAPLVDRSVRGPEMGFVSQDVYDGSLSRYLLYPISFWKYKYASFLADSALALLQLLGVILFCVLFFDFQFSISNFFMSFTLMLAATLCYFFLSAMIECISFWQDNVWSLVYIFRLCMAFGGGLMIPPQMLSEFWRNVFSWTPFPYMVATPVRALMGQVIWADVVTGVTVIVFWMLICVCGFAILWRRGLKQYSGVGM